jgi:molybdopterin-guanine dinucleotide biosynthesis protein A
LEGLATGFHALDGSVDVVYATACDVPLLVPAFVDRMFELLDDFDIAAPFDGQYHHPLASVYRPTVLEHIQRLLDSERMRPRFLFDEVSTREIPIDELRAVDPQLSTLTNLNYEQDYITALISAGFALPPDARQ